MDSPELSNATEDGNQLRVDNESSSVFFFYLLNYQPFSSSPLTLDAFAIADPNSMQDVCHIRTSTRVYQ